MFLRLEFFLHVLKLALSFRLLLLMLFERIEIKRNFLFKQRLLLIKVRLQRHGPPVEVFSGLLML